MPPGHAQNVPSDSETESQITPIASKKKGKKTSKNPSACSQLNLDPMSSQVINLAQDLDEQNAKVKCKPQRRDPVFDYFKNFFSEPYCCKGDVRINSNLLVVLKADTKPPSTYKCFRCKKGVHVSGRLSDGCPKIQKAIEKVSQLPANSLQELKTKQIKKKALSLFASTNQIMLTTNLSIASYLCGFYVKQSHGP
ncbi:hypothetical protein VP01_7471g1, partial [Puccinia sorghi]